MYWKENVPVFILFFFFNLSILLMGFLDTGIPDVSVIYIFSFNFMIFIIYLIWDYIRKRKFGKDFQNLESLDDVTGMNEGETPQQRMTYEKLDELRIVHHQALEAESAKTKENLDELTRFIHDMKMPMTTMKLMLDDLPEPEGGKLLNEWTRLNGMLNEVLYLKRLPDIKNDLYIEPVDLNDILKHSIRKLREVCIRKHIGFDIDLQKNIVYTDMKWCQFIIDQLITNSVKYSSDDDIIIRSEECGDFTRLSITDYGRGIETRDIGRIFEAGFTSTTDHDDEQSTGMGLYIAKNVADILNINLTAESCYGEYTTMTIEFSHEDKLIHLTAK
jgi:OmpR family two-component system bacitracin resistance sensor histidine kinase BceS